VKPFIVFLIWVSLTGCASIRSDESPQPAVMPQASTANPKDSTTAPQAIPTQSQNTIASPQLTPVQEQARELAKDYARQNLGPGYVDGITYVELDHEDHGNPVFHVYNPGPGHTVTIDWLTVDLATNNVTAMFTQIIKYEEIDFSINIQDTLLGLRGWDNEIDLASLLGPPITEQITTLENADTFTGSFLKEATYPGLDMHLFSPKENGKTFWIMNMKLSNATWITAKGLRVGMSLDDLKKAYPEIPLALDGRTDPDNCAYEIANRNTYEYARYEVKDGIIRAISIYHEIP